MYQAQSLERLLPLFDARLDFRFRFRRFRSASDAHGFGGGVGVGFWQKDDQEDGLSDEKHEGKNCGRGINVEFVSPRFGKWPSSKISPNGRANAETHCECDAYK